MLKSIIGNSKTRACCVFVVSKANICREEITHNSFLRINWKTSMKFILNLNFLLWKFGPGREFTENPWQHIKLSHLSLQTRFFILRHLRKQQLYSESSRWNISSNIEDHLEILASWELFRQKWVLCNSAAKGFFCSHFHLIKTSTQLQIQKVIF